jgi:hypothetical protein
MLNYLTVSFSILSLSIWAFLSTIGVQKSPNRVEVTVLTPLPINSTHIPEANAKKLPKSPQLKEQVDSSLQFALNIAQKHIAKNKFLKESSTPNQILSTKFILVEIIIFQKTNHILLSEELINRRF